MEPRSGLSAARHAERIFRFQCVTRKRMQCDFAVRLALPFIIIFSAASAISPSHAILLSRRRFLEMSMLRFCLLGFG